MSNNSSNSMALNANNDHLPQNQRIVEFVYAGELRQQLPLILPTLAHLSHNADQRWLTCVGSLFLSKKDCLSFQLSWQRLLQVLPNQRCAIIELAERALLAGKSHTVVCLAPSVLSQQELARLERAATVGRCQGIVIHGR